MRRPSFLSLSSLSALTIAMGVPAGAVLLGRDLVRNAVAISLLSIALLAFLLVTPSLAQEDASPFNAPVAAFAIEAAYTLLGPLVAGAVIAVLARLYSLLGLQQTAANRATVEQVLEMAVRYARVRLGMGNSFAPIPKELIDNAVEIAADQAMERGPKALGKFGIRNAQSNSLRTMLVSRMDGGAILAEEPATIS